MARYINVDKFRDEAYYADTEADVVSYIRTHGCANVVEPDKLKKLIERKYGSLDNTCGCNVNGRWLSVAAIVELIEQAVKE